MMILLSLLMAFPSFATPEQEAQSCQSRVERGGSIQVQVNAAQSGACFVSVGNFKRTGMVYRSYLFADDGNFMIFNSYGNGPISETTGAREFYSFPRRFKNPTFKWNEELRRLEVTSCTGDVYYFDYETAEISGMDKAQTKLADAVGKDNKGGVEITAYKGLMMDAGFKMGQAPTQNPAGPVKFTDENGKVCNLTVGDIFKYKEDGDPYVRFKDKELATFLKKKCPKLKFPAL
ncbi:MAG: hypothetical protein J7501_09465 [Bdellovibrio sp.]|nr:hypothetical protein [Bdellovibrio sp.]